MSAHGAHSGPHPTGLSTALPDLLLPAVLWLMHMAIGHGHQQAITRDVQFPSLAVVKALLPGLFHQNSPNSHQGLEAQSRLGMEGH